MYKTWLKPFVIQEHRHHVQEFHNQFSRVNYDELFDSLKYPLIWVYDDLLDSWIPSEVDFAFIKFVQTLQQGKECIVENVRYYQLCRSGLVYQPRPTISELKASMDKDGYVVLPNLLDPLYCKTLTMQYYWRNDHLHNRWPERQGIKRTSINNVPLMRLLHESTEKFVNSLISTKVKTSYSFCSAYESGSNLPAHTDRPQCVYNISLLLGSSPDDADLKRWPLFIKRNDTIHEIALNAGDAVLYSGTRDLHWRDVLPSDLKLVLGVFFHFVPYDFNGSLD